MRFFTLHERPARTGGDPEVLAVASGFRWSAAIVPPLWLLWHRLWLGFALYMLFSILLGIALAVGDIADPAATAIGIAVSFLIGAGAADYRRWTLQRRGWRFGGVLRASDAAEAEALYIRNHSAGPAGASSVAMPPSSPQGFPPAVLPQSGSSDAFPRLL
jgi:hypothetical protein